jgi:hypothetical protein
MNAEDPFLPLESLGPSDSVAHGVKYEIFQESNHFSSSQKLNCSPLESLKYTLCGYLH